MRRRIMKMKIKRMVVKRGDKNKNKEEEEDRVGDGGGNEQAGKISIVAGKGYRISNRNETTVYYSSLTSR